MASTYRITRAAYLESLEDFREFIKEHCTGFPGVTDEILYDVQLAVDEACTNIITHGYSNMDPGSVILDLELDPDRLSVSLTDFGHSFEPGEAPVADVHASIEERELGGFGLFFINQSMDKVDYRVTEDGNTMILTKYLTKSFGGERMKTEVKRENDVSIVSVSGSVDALTAPDLARAIVDEIAEGQVRLVIDLIDVEFMSSAGLRTLLGGVKESRSQGGDLRIASTNPGVDKVLKMSGFQNIAKVFTSPTDAVASFE